MAQTAATVSITSCNVDRSGKLGTISVDEENGAAGKYELTYTIQMIAACGPLAIIKAAQGLVGAGIDTLPTLWSTYSYKGDTDDKSYAKSLTVSRNEKGATLCYVTVSYEPLAPGEMPDGGGVPILAEPDPLKRKPVFWWEPELSTKLRTVAQDGSAVKNFANGLYSDLIETEHTKSIQVVEFNVATANDVNTYIRAYEDSVNVNDWNFRGTIYPQRSVNIRSVSAKPPQSEGDHTFCTVKMRIAFAALGQVWDVALPEMGQTYFTKTGGAYDLDAQGFRKRGNAGSLVPLASDGTRLDDGSPILTTPWRVAREVDYGPLSTIFNR